MNLQVSVWYTYMQVAGIYQIVALWNKQHSKSNKETRLEAVFSTFKLTALIWVIEYLFPAQAHISVEKNNATLHFTHASINVFSDTKTRICWLDGTISHVNVTPWRPCWHGLYNEDTKCNKDYIHLCLCFDVLSSFLFAKLETSYVPVDKKRALNIWLDISKAPTTKNSLDL